MIARRYCAIIPLGTTGGALQFPSQIFLVSIRFQLCRALTKMAGLGQASQISGSRSIYTKLNREDMEIRLLEILPEDSTDSQIKCLMRKARSSVDAYSALSYTWDDPTMTQQIFVNGEKISVTTSLYSALRQLRQKQHTT